jgi:hypothetical protein
MAFIYVQVQTVSTELFVQLYGFGTDPIIAHFENSKTVLIYADYSRISTPNDGHDLLIYLQFALCQTYKVKLKDYFH